MLRHGVGKQGAYACYMARKSFFLFEWREYRQLTQEQLGARLDPEISGASISRIESGKHNYTRSRLEGLAVALNIEVADLFRDPTKPDYQLWRVIAGMKPDEQETALRLIRAMKPGGDDPAPDGASPLKQAKSSRLRRYG